MPFRLVGDEANTKYLADGVVDSLSAKLAALKNVYVASPNAVTAAQSKQDPAKIARTLGVTLLVQGTVQSSADKIAITVTMEDLAKGGRTLLHQDFSGVREDLLTLEDRVFGALVSALAIKPTNEEMARTALKPTEDIGAYDLYLKGRNLWRGAQNSTGLQEAAGFFDRALQLDPRFALAYTGLADAYLRMWDQTKDSAWTQKALGAAHQAQALNDNLPEVHFVLGSIYTATGLTSEAIAELQRALQLAPNSDESLRRLGVAYAAAGRQQEAIAAYTKAIQVNPYLWTNYNFLGAAYFRLGDNDKALEAFQHITELEPDRASGYANVGAVYYRQGRWTECIPMFQKAIALQPSPVYYSNLGTTLFFTGRYNDAAGMFEKAAEMKPNDASIRGNLADAYRWAGQTAKAAATYDQAISLAFKSFQVNPRDTQALGNLAVYYAKKGDSNRALSFIRQARGIDRTGNALMYKEATIHALAGQNQEALASLGEALRSGYSMQEAKSDPELKNLRQAAEFGRLQQELSAKSSK
jgi:tetratricopeptide (TPR) repeat protein